jgi:N-acetylneuraminate synthase
MSIPPDISIANRLIGAAHPPYIIAEISGNHGGKLEAAFRLIDAAKNSGADAVKLQTYTADTITLDHDAPEFWIKDGLWDKRRLYDLYREAYTPWEWHKPLFDYAKQQGIVIFSSAFDPTAIDLLESLDAPAYKIASFEILDLPLIRLAASTGKPLIISTGMASLAEIVDAVDAAQAAGAQQLILLHCISGYPAPCADANLATIPALAKAFGLNIGLSDHTLGTAVSVAAVALGASVIEKHLSLSGEGETVDSAFSLADDGFGQLVADCQGAHQAIGRVTFGPVASEANVLSLRRSLYVVADIAAGETIGPHNVRSIRPGLGLAPKFTDLVMGRMATRALSRGMPLHWDMIGASAKS